MNWREFYDELKIGLHALGVSWKESALVKIRVENGRVFMDLEDNKTYSFKVEN